MEQTEPETFPPQEHSGGVHDLSDRELVAEVLRKDRKATAEFVARCADHVYTYVRRRLIPRTDLVEDLMQEVFLAAWENLETFRGESSLRSWLLGIARHKVEDHYRRRLRDLPIQEEDEISSDDLASSDDLEASLATHQAGQRMREILSQLPEIYCLVLLWRYWEKRSVREIAAQTERTEKAVERLLARARQQFKKRWNERRSPARR